MKYLLLLFILVIFAEKLFSQNRFEDTVTKYRNAHASVITAKDAYKYVGKMVAVVDSLYSSKIINDTTLACQMGEQTGTPRLTLLFINAYNKNHVNFFFKSFKRYRLTIYGTITGTKDAPVLILRDPNNMTFDYKPHGNEY